MTPRTRSAGANLRTDTESTPKPTPTPKKAAARKTTTPGKAKASPSASKKKSSAKAKKKGGRTPLKERDANVNVPTTEDVEVDPSAAKKGILDLPEKVLKRVFGFCLEEPKEGHYVAQRTLAAALRVNNLFLKIAGEVLYLSPVVVNVESFFLGSHRSMRGDQGYFFGPGAGGTVKQQLEKAIGGMDTRLPLLEHVQHLHILSCVAPKMEYGKELQPTISKRYIDGLIKSKEYKDLDMDTLPFYWPGYWRTKKIFRAVEERVKQNLTPNLIDIKIGGLLKIPYEEIDFVDDAERLKYLDGLIELDIRFGEGIASLREDLWDHCRPIEWCDYQHHLTRPWRPVDLKDIHLVKKDPTIPTRHKQYIPDLWTVHTTLFEPFSVNWGSANRIVLRQFTAEERPARDRRLMCWEDCVNSVEIEGEQYPYLPDVEDAERVFYGFSNQVTMDRSQEIISNTIRDSYPSKFCKPQLDATTKKELEDETYIDIYGFEEIHPPTDEQLESTWKDRKNIVKNYKKDKKVDLTYIAKQIENAGYSLDNDTYTPKSKSKSSEPARSGENETEDEDTSMVDGPSGSGGPLSLRDVQLQLWLSTLDYKMINSLRAQLKASNKKWTNGDAAGSAGPTVRFKPLRDLPECGTTVIDYVGGEGGFQMIWGVEYDQMFP
ncbi:uncharacterized protein I303_107657 [Kwoniella dejecticola CBS 10117]|uniref:Uncharacterized protein n=1 Tax=Kwoniella dejecticola CBS 10117 TaxID=1296121 RepID=A0A1A5ZVC6_9TREE|nr:uncharacterized protein I303_07667 [Kwoniella dejecticola CBS 10117]OBR81757.1 hypothetical protein I303_07667 [Kwoniella dejecticola CBS 10117]